jgi:hypothetical protein
MLGVAKYMIKHTVVNRNRQSLCGTVEKGHTASGSRKGRYWYLQKYLVPCTWYVRKFEIA